MSALYDNKGNLIGTVGSTVNLSGNPEHQYWIQINMNEKIIDTIETYTQTTYIIQCEKRWIEVKKEDLRQIRSAKYSYYQRTDETISTVQRKAYITEQLFTCDTICALITLDSEYMKQNDSPSNIEILNAIGQDKLINAVASVTFHDGKYRTDCDIFYGVYVDFAKPFGNVDPMVFSPTMVGLPSRSQRLNNFHSQAKSEITTRQIVVPKYPKYKYFYVVRTDYYCKHESTGQRFKYRFEKNIQGILAKDVNAQISNLSAQLVSLKKQKAKAKQNQNKRAQLKGEKNSLLVRNNHLYDLIKQYYKEINETNADEIAKLQKQINELNNKKATKNAKLALKEVELSKVNIQIAECRNQMDQIAAQLGRGIPMQDPYYDPLVRQQLVATFDDLSKQLYSGYTDLDGIYHTPLNKQQYNIQCDINNLKEDIAQIEGQISAKQSELASLSNTAGNQQLRNKIKACDDEIKKNHQKIQSIDNQIASLQSIDINDLENKINDTNEQMDKLINFDYIKKEIEQKLKNESNDEQEKTLLQFNDLNEYLISNAQEKEKANQEFNQQFNQAPTRHAPLSGQYGIGEKQCKCLQKTSQYIGSFDLSTDSDSRNKCLALAQAKMKQYMQDKDVYTYYNIKIRESNYNLSYSVNNVTGDTQSCTGRFYLEFQCKKA